MTSGLAGAGALSPVLSHLSKSFTVSATTMRGTVRFFERFLRIGPTPNKLPVGSPGPITRHSQNDELGWIQPLHAYPDAVQSPCTLMVLGWLAYCPGGGSPCRAAFW